MAEQTDGRWVTLDNGVHLFIKKGQTLDDAIEKLETGTSNEESKKKIFDEATQKVKERKELIEKNEKDPNVIKFSNKDKFIREFNKKYGTNYEFDGSDAVDENGKDFLNLGDGINKEDLEKQLLKHKEETKKPEAKDRTIRKFGKIWGESQGEVTSVVTKSGKIIGIGDKVDGYEITGFDPETNSVNVDGSDYAVEDIEDLVKTTTKEQKEEQKDYKNLSAREYGNKYGKQETKGYDERAIDSYEEGFTKSLNSYNKRDGDLHAGYYAEKEEAIKAIQGKTNEEIKDYIEQRRRELSKEMDKAEEKYYSISNYSNFGKRNPEEIDRIRGKQAFYSALDGAVVAQRIKDRYGENDYDAEEKKNKENNDRIAKWQEENDRKVKEIEDKIHGLSTNDAVRNRALELAREEYEKRLKDRRYDKTSKEIWKDDLKDIEAVISSGDAGYMWELDTVVRDNIQDFVEKAYNEKKSQKKTK